MPLEIKDAEWITVEQAGLVLVSPADTCMAWWSEKRKSKEKPRFPG